MPSVEGMTTTPVPLAPAPAARLLRRLAIDSLYVLVGFPLGMIRTRGHHGRDRDTDSDRGRGRPDPECGPTADPSGACLDDGSQVRLVER